MFIAIAEVGNLTRGAKRAYLTIPAPGARFRKRLPWNRCAV